MGDASHDLPSLPDLDPTGTAPRETEPRGPGAPSPPTGPSPRVGSSGAPISAVEPKNNSDTEH